MELILFVIFVLISLALISLGLFITEHTELSLVGFLFLFLLSMILLTGTITTKTGSVTNTTYMCINGSVSLSSEEKIDVYQPISWDGTLSHSIGFWLAIASFIGFIGVIIGIRRTNNYE